MSISLVPVHADFVVRLEGLDLSRPVDEPTFARMRRALDDHGVLILPRTPLTDELQMAFSERWGPMEPTKGTNPASGTVFARQSNLDLETGEIIPSADRRMAYQKGNYQWHADSTFKRTPSLCSILSARIVPGVGGNTEFVSTRAAYDALPDALKTRVADLVVEHDFSVSRARVGFTFTEEEAAIYPPVWHPLVQRNPVTGRKSLLIGAHASSIVGWPADEGRALLRELLERATQADSIYSHRWAQDDVVLWDNRSVLHRATAYDAERHQRLMQRTTIGNPAILASPEYRKVARLRGDDS